MSRAFPVLKREYLEVVRKKSFIVLTLLMPFLMAGMMFLPALLAVRGVADKTIAVVDGTGLLAAAFEAEAGPPVTENVPRQLRAAARSTRFARPSASTPSSSSSRATARSSPVSPASRGPGSTPAAPSCA